MDIPVVKDMTKEYISYTFNKCKWLLCVHMARVCVCVCMCVHVCVCVYMCIYVWMVDIYKMKYYARTDGL